MSENDTMYRRFGHACRRYVAAVDTHVTPPIGPHPARPMKLQRFGSGTVVKARDVSKFNFRTTSGEAPKLRSETCPRDKESLDRWGGALAKIVCDRVEAFQFVSPDGIRSCLTFANQADAIDVVLIWCHGHDIELGSDTAACEYGWASRTDFAARGSGRCERQQPLRRHPLKVWAKDAPGDARLGIFPDCVGAPPFDSRPLWCEQYALGSKHRLS